MTPPDGAQDTRRATLRDVASAAGVSQSTTSRALNGAGYVAPPVRERILRAAEQLGYVPHGGARSLRQQVSRAIGVLVSDLRNAFYADLTTGAAWRARALGYTMMLVDARGSAEDELGAARSFVASRAAGVIVTPVSPEVSAFLIAQRVPLVEVDRQFRPGECDAVVVDNRQVAHRVVCDLIGLGHRRIAMLVDQTEWTTGAERLLGYRRAHEEAGLVPDPALLVIAGWDAASAYRATTALLTQEDAPTALFAVNNVLAEGVWRAVGDLGLQVPGAVSVVCFDDAAWMSLVTPGVTAVAQDGLEIGAAAVDRLLTRIARPTDEPRTVTLSAQIRSRGSTAAPSRA